MGHAQGTGNVAKTCRYFGISRQGFYKQRHVYEQFGEAGLINSRPCPENPSRRTPPEIEEKILYLRRNYHFGPHRIAWYLERYHGFRMAGSGVYCVLSASD